MRVIFPKIRYIIYIYAYYMYILCMSWRFAHILCDFFKRIKGNCYLTPFMLCNYLLSLPITCVSNSLHIMGSDNNSLHSMSLTCCIKSHCTPVTLAPAHTPCLFSIDLHTVGQHLVIVHFLLLLLLSGTLFPMMPCVPHNCHHLSLV